MLNILVVGTTDMENKFTYNSWHNIPWDECNKVVFRMQQEIVVAYTEGN